MIRTYSELLTFQTFMDRYNYLKLSGRVGVETFGFDRYLNQILYRSKRWRELRPKIITRDNACDMAMENHDIFDRIIVHHMNPISLEDIEDDNDDIFDPEFLICVSSNTHNAIHFGDNRKLAKPIIQRRPNDTCPWKE